MALDHDLIGVESPPYDRGWSAKDTMLYALGVGAGVAELAFTTEKGQRVLPTFAVLAAQAPSGRRLGDFDPALLVHAEQAFELHRELPAAGGVRTTSKVTGIYDKGSGALVTSEARAVDQESGEPVITSRSAVFIRGEGGFGGDRGPRDELCTYGVTGRALLHAVAGSDPGRFGAMSGRFTSPVFPGESLTVSIWVDGSAVLFRTAKDDGTVVIDRGRAVISPRPGL
ncbi:MaoC/PaaZ C-terminal domain-containing protein [Nonomuraea sp. NEAU-A123]|uniref:MaoC/PaaZ C-terminal domain-containing protein n=1 Tax=Nonomuraea sp. NEAU-A123 TaxID=2839649 RepID=UPI001BE43469|nr:MaoC/PaaZ C-terminal domain-containing protein [Nonomuraea sp. NEAU-A123]MBT2228476.1 MaoC family dehydratase N-terminal domain-containing protein [Nonomuraea sp. NEAU-A123]